MKNLFTVLLLGGTFAVCAQDTTVMRGQNTMRNTSQNANNNYTPYMTVTDVPITVQRSYQTDHPTAGTANWQHNGQWYSTTYNDAGRIYKVYYNQTGKGYKVALPVLHSYVSEDFIVRASQAHQNIYSVSTIKNAKGEDVYKVVAINNGQTSTHWMNEDGSAIMETDIYRVDTTDGSDTAQMRTTKASTNEINDATETTEINNVSTTTTTDATEATNTETTEAQSTPENKENNLEVNAQKGELKNEEAELKTVDAEE